MKRKLCLLIALMLVLSIGIVAQAAGTVKPGDTFTASFSYSSSTGVSGRAQLSFDTSAFEFVSASGGNVSPNKATGYYTMGSGVSPIGTITLSVTLKVKSTAKSGNYSVTAINTECWDIEYEEAAASIGSYSVTVQAACTHANAEWSETTPATCTQKGLREKICPDCKETIDSEEIDPLGHDFGEYEVTTPATCTEDGVEEAECQREGCTEKETRSITKLGHDFGEYEVVTPATCTEDGVEEAKCQREGCTEKETRPSTKLGHSFGEYEVVTPATCTEDGVEEAKCQREGCTEKETRSITKLGHQFGSFEVVTPATCTEPGVKEAKCQREGCTETKQEEIPATGHHGVWKVITPATKDAEGLKQKICTNCEAVLDEEIIPILSTVYCNASVGGLKFSELGIDCAAADAWKMVAAIDLTEMGEKEYPIISFGQSIVGYLVVDVTEDGVKIDIKMRPGIYVDFSHVALAFDLADLTDFNLENYAYNGDIPCEFSSDEFGGNTAIILGTFKIHYDESRVDLGGYNFRGQAHKAYVEDLKAILG